MQCTGSGRPKRSHCNPLWCFKGFYFEFLEVFHVVSGLPPYIMHDVLEGALPWELKLMLKCLIDKRYLTLEQLNSRIKLFPYGEEERNNKPSEILRTNLISVDTSFRQ